jgi:multiple sugar transport system permease protein
VLAALPLIVVFMFFQRQIIKGIATTGIAGT